MEEKWNNLHKEEKSVDFGGKRIENKTLMPEILYMNKDFESMMFLIMNHFSNKGIEKVIPPTNLDVYKTFKENGIEVDQKIIMQSYKKTFYSKDGQWIDKIDF